MELLKLVVVGTRQEDTMSVKPRAETAVRRLRWRSDFEKKCLVANFDRRGCALFSSLSDAQLSRITRLTHALSTEKSWLETLTASNSSLFLRAAAPCSI